MDPLHQFNINPIVPIMVGNTDISFSNSALSMVAAMVMASTLMIAGGRKAKMIPGRIQCISEAIYEFISKLVIDNCGREAVPYVPFVFSIFVFILFGNLLGMVPGLFTFTSHIIVTFGIAVLTVGAVTGIGFARNGLEFLRIFMPSGVPLYVAPLLVPVEIISYLSRPISLSVRLFANMMAGHTMLKVFASFSVMGIASLGMVKGMAIAVGPMLINVALTGFELMVACLQAYVFVILTCIYLRDAIHPHH